MIRGAYYAVEMPLWEGFDEYAHFARFSESALPRSSETISREVEQSFHLAPLPDQLGWMGPWARTHRQWWALPEEERRKRIQALHEIHPRGANQPSTVFYSAYEAQQPPLYYWLLWPALHLAQSFGLTQRVLLARLFSLMIASAAIPLTFGAARRLRPFGPVLGPALGPALGAAALLAVSPMFALDTARVANDCLAIAITAWLVYLLTDPRAKPWAVGLALGLALLSKAYLLALIPAILWLWRKKRSEATIAMAVAGLTAGWWYVRNLLVGGRLSGWEDDAPLPAILRNLPHVDWPHAAGAVFKSALWFGGWSFLTVKAWIYNLLLLVLGACVANALRNWLSLRVPLVFIGCFLLGMIYDVGAEFTGHGTSSAPGWYLWALSSAGAILVAAGAARFIPYVLVSLAALDFYSSNFVLLPYHAGFAEHGRSFAHPFLFMEALARLHLPFSLWLANSVATAAIPVVALLNHKVSTHVSITRTGLTLD